MMDNKDLLIKELSKDIPKGIDEYGEASVIGDSHYVAKELVDKGYRKIKWHKVADGDLPPMVTDVLCCKMCRTGHDAFTEDGYTYTVLFYNGDWMTKDYARCYAPDYWTELPKCEGIVL